MLRSQCVTVVTKMRKYHSNYPYGPGTLFQVRIFGGKNILGCWAFRAFLAPFDLIKEATKPKEISLIGVTGACRCGIGPVPLGNKLF